MEIITILRQYRIGPFTIFDTVLAYGALFLLAPFLTKVFLKMHIVIPKTSWLWLTLPISVVFHLVFRQNTPFMKMLLDPSGFYTAKIVLVCMLYMGLRNVKYSKKIDVLGML